MGDFAGYGASPVFLYRKEVSEMKHSFSLRETEPVFGRIRSAPQQRVVKNLLLNLAIAVLIEIICIGMQITAYIAVAFGQAIVDALRGKTDDNTAGIIADSMAFSLFLTAICVVLCMLYCLVLERRPLRTLGFAKRHSLRDYLIGAAAGFLLMSGAVMLSWAFGGVTFAGIAENIPWGTLVILFLGWMIQGFSEELNFRGYLMMTLGTHHKPLTAVAVSSLAFAAMHLGNDGIGVFPIVNLTLFGVLAALYFLRTDSIWGIAALHSVWNAVQGNFYGCLVSGIENNAAILHFEQVSGMEWLNGGAFGPEGGAGVTAVLLLGIVILWLLPQKKEEQSNGTETKGIL